MTALCLDLATTTGWACGNAEPGRPVTHGICKMPKTGEDIGRFLAVFRDWLHAAIDDMQPTEIFFEAPILPESMGMASRRKLYSLAGVTELVALDTKTPVREANLSDIRKHFIGVVRAPKDIAKDKRRQWIKERVMAECRRRGFRVAGDDDADAIALLSFALSLDAPDFDLRQPDPEHGWMVRRGLAKAAAA